MDPTVATHLTNIRKDLDAAGRGQRGELIKSAAEYLGVSVQTVYRHLKTLGLTAPRNRRASTRTVSREHAEQVAKIMNASRSAKGVIRMPACEAFDIAKANGLIPQHLGKDAVRRAMHAYRVHPEITRTSTYTTVKSLHPNHVWQLDPSICVLYYLDNGGLAAMSERHFYKNKPENIQKVSRDRVLRYVISDHATGAFFVRYYLTPGESVEVLFEFLMEAFAERPGQPFHGVPLNLIWDKGSANTSHAIQNVLDALGVNHWTHEVGNSRAKGQVESAQWTIETHFESRLALTYVENLQQLNGLCDKWQISFNASRIHGRTKHSRYGLWQTIRAEHLRKPPSREICQALLNAKPQQRKVKGNLTVQFTVKGCQPAFYDVSHVEGVYPGQSVDVTVNPYRVPNIFLIAEDPEGRRTHYECEAVAMDQFGFPVDAPVLGSGEYKATRETDLDAARKRHDIAAWGSADTADIEKARKDRKPAFNGEIDAFKDIDETATPDFMERPGTELHVPNPVHVEAVNLTHIQALKLLKRRLARPLTASENTAVRETYPDGVPEDAIEQLLESLTQPARPALSVVGGQS